MHADMSRDLEYEGSLSSDENRCDSTTLVAEVIRPPEEHYRSLTQSLQTTNGGEHSLKGEDFSSVSLQLVVSRLD